MTESPLADIREHFGRLEDPRVDRTKLQALIDILVIAICAVICGAEDWPDTAQTASGQRKGRATTPTAVRAATPQVNELATECASSMPNRGDRNFDSQNLLFCLNNNLITSLQNSILQSLSIAVRLR